VRIEIDCQTRYLALTAAQEVPIRKEVSFNSNKNSTFSCNLIWNETRVQSQNI